jgi:hypothetical protein
VTSWILPIVMLYAASANPQLKEFGIYYAIPLVPFLVPGASFGALAVTRRFTGNERTARAHIVGIVLLAAIVVYGDRAGYSLRPWKPEIRAMPVVMRARGRARRASCRAVSIRMPVTIRKPCWTPETLRDPRSPVRLPIAPRAARIRFDPASWIHCCDCRRCLNRRAGGGGSARVSPVRPRSPRLP